MKNMGKLMKQAQQMQNNLANMQEEFNKKEFETTVGGGKIKIIMTGDQKLVDIKIDPEVLDDVEMLQDMIVAGTNKLHDEIKDEMAKNMSSLTGGMNIPGLF
jgi:nucleoid-associated protein EbfC